MHKDDAVRLRHMLDAVREAQGFVVSRSRADLEHDFDIDRDIVWNTVADDLPPSRGVGRCRFCPRLTGHRSP